MAKNLDKTLDRVDRTLDKAKPWARLVGRLADWWLSRSKIRQERRRRRRARRVARKARK